MNIDDLNAKMDEILSVAKSLHAETIDLRSNVESLQRTVVDLQERLTYREKILVGWKEIATHIDVDPRWAQEMAKEPFHPLPVFREHGRIVAYATMLDAHKLHHRAPYVAETRKAMRLVPRETDEPMS